MGHFRRSSKSALAIFLASTLALGSVTPSFARDNDRGPSSWNRRDGSLDWRGERGWDQSRSLVLVSERVRPYRPYPFPRDRYSYGTYLHRPYGHRHPGFSFYYRDNDALAVLGVAALSLVFLNQLSAAQHRAHEEAMIRATSAPIGDSIIWNQGGSSGSVTTIRDGQTVDGRPCREFQQEVMIGGKREQAYGTACQQPGGDWKIVNN